MPGSRRSSKGSLTKGDAAASKSASPVLCGPWDNSVTLNEGIRLAIAECSKRLPPDGVSTISVWRLTLLLIPPAHWALSARLGKASDYDGEGALMTLSTSTQAT